jgi:hypothetical protein
VKAEEWQTQQLSSFFRHIRHGDTQATHLSTLFPQLGIELHVCN